MSDNLNEENETASFQPDDCGEEAPQEIACEGEEAATSSDETETLKNKIEELEKALKEKSEAMLRRAADLDNYRKRLIKELDEQVKYANQAVIKDFIPVLDNIELTLIHAEEGSPLRQGIELTIKSFKDALLKHGIKEINAEAGVPFDPAVHEALMMDSSEDFENNAVTLCVQKGYTLNDRVVRPAKVKVNKR